MKTTILAVFLTLCLASPLAGQTAPYNYGAPQQPPLLAPADVDALTGPVALYPDALLGIILPASTCSTDIQSAASLLASVPGAQAVVDSQPWDQSVRALAHYPDVLGWMYQNLGWTQQLGSAFYYQPQDVMVSIQRLRQQAMAFGNLVTNAQQTVIVENGYIRIVPTNVNQMYVPYYDPSQVFYTQAAFGFSPAWPCGPWLAYDCNWVGDSVWVGSWSPGSFLRPAWRIASNTRSQQYLSTHVWRPNPARPPVRVNALPSRTPARPAPINAAPAGARPPAVNQQRPPANIQQRPPVNTQQRPPAASQPQPQRPVARPASAPTTLRTQPPPPQNFNNRPAVSQQPARPQSQPAPANNRPAPPPAAQQARPPAAPHPAAPAAAAKPASPPPRPASPPPARPAPPPPQNSSERPSR